LRRIDRGRAVLVGRAPPTKTLCRAWRESENMTAALSGGDCH
jgi:hypothetical protein